MDMNALDSMSSGSGQARDDLSHLQADPGDPELGENFRVAYTYDVRAQTHHCRHQRRLRQTRLCYRNHCRSARSRAPQNSARPFHCGDSLPSMV